MPPPVPATPTPPILTETPKDLFFCFCVAADVAKKAMEDSNTRIHEKTVARVLLLLAKPSVY